MRLQALVRGHNVRKQAQMTMRCMQALVRVQARVRARRRLQLQGRNHDHDQKKKKVVLEKEEEINEGQGEQPKTKIPVVFNKKLNEAWEVGKDQSHQRWSEQNNYGRKHEHHAVMKRERALAYAFSYPYQYQYQYQYQV